MRPLQDRVLAHPPACGFVAKIRSPNHFILEFAIFMTRLSPQTVCVVAVGLALVVARLSGDEYKSGIAWPEPKVIDPGPVCGGPPSDAIVLIGGKDLSAWEGAEKWLYTDGVATVHSGSAKTRQGFGDCQLHAEWATPEKVEGAGQGRGNSGIFLMEKYELQILDSYENQTYFDGQAGSIYKQTPPLVNACRKPGEWQTYDIIFMAPHFDAAGKLEKPAFITVLQNGVLVQNNFKIEGTTAWDVPPAYSAHPDKLPIGIQDHGNPARFRNVWIREL